MGQKKYFWNGNGPMLQSVTEHTESLDAYVAMSVEPRCLAVDLLNHVKSGAWGETEDAHGIAHDARAGMMAHHQQHQETEGETGVEIAENA